MLLFSLVGKHRWKLSIRVSRYTTDATLVAHEAVDFGGDHNGFAACVGFQKPAEHFLARASRVDVRRVKEVDSEIKCLSEEGLAFFFVKRPSVATGSVRTRGWRAIRHAAETDAGNLEAGFAEVDAIH